MRYLKLPSKAALTAATTCSALAQTHETAPLPVTVDGLRNGKGAVIVAVSSGKAATSNPRLKYWN